MLDLSNNNGAVDFQRIYRSGQRRVYLKLTEGDHFLDKDAAQFFHRATAAHLKVGFYHFARPSKNSAIDEAKYFLRCLPPGWKAAGHTLRPCLDLEDPDQSPKPSIGIWAAAWLAYVKQHGGITPIIYGSSWYLQTCALKKPPSLWLASYGRNDGKEHAYVIPKPWSPRQLAAHQFASEARVAGVAGNVDISHVFRGRLLDVRRFSR